MVVVASLLHYNIRRCVNVLVKNWDPRRVRQRGQETGNRQMSHNSWCEIMKELGRARRYLSYFRRKRAKLSVLAEGEYA